MKTLQPLSIAVVLAAGALACGPKADTAVPDGAAGACTEEAKVCDDGSTVVREGPQCEFAACPGEQGEGDPEADADAEGEADAEPAAEEEGDQAAEPAAEAAE